MSTTQELGTCRQAYKGGMLEPSQARDMIPLSSFDVNSQMYWYIPNYIQQDSGKSPIYRRYYAPRRQGTPGSWAVHASSTTIALHEDVRTGCSGVGAQIKGMNTLMQRVRSSLTRTVKSMFNWESNFLSCLSSLST
jgi:hypothetical protein